MDKNFLRLLVVMITSVIIVGISIRYQSMTVMLSNSIPESERKIDTRTYSVDSTTLPFQNQYQPAVLYSVGPYRDLYLNRDPSVTWVWVEHRMIVNQYTLTPGKCVRIDGRNIQLSVEKKDPIHWDYKIENCW